MRQFSAILGSDMGPGDEGSIGGENSSPAERVRIFNQLMGIPMPDSPDPTRLQDAMLARKIESMLESEVAELKKGIAAGDLSNVGRELADIVYTAYGAALELGLDLDQEISRVHEANLTRRSSRGDVQRRADGKILKGDQYRPPL